MVDKLKNMENVDTSFTASASVVEVDNAIVSTSSRSVNWDLLRSLAMLLVVVVHTARYLNPVGDVNVGGIIGSAALICDPIFFVLSGYFALGPIRRTLKNYYVNKVITILLPMVFYSILLYLIPFRLREISIGGYFKGFTDLLTNGWWFIPTLVPCLMVAPFLSKGIEALSDKTIVTIVKIYGILIAMGATCLFFQWLFESKGIETLAYFFSFIQLFVPPSFLSLGIMYFQFFILGGLFRRIAPLISRRTGNIFIFIGIVCWILDVIWTYFGIPRIDPSYFWVFGVFGIMILFNRLTIAGRIAKNAISWTAKRSYSIYLLQFTAIAFLTSVIYSKSIFGDVAQMDAIAQIAVWVATTLASYLSSLIVASICDPLLLNKLQSLLKRKLLKE